MRRSDQVLVAGQGQQERFGDVYLSVDYQGHDVKIVVLIFVVFLRFVGNRRDAVPGRAWSRTSASCDLA